MKKAMWDIQYISDQQGRVAIVTGASSGIGEETARVLALKGATVILAVRNLDKGRRVASRIRKDTRNTTVAAAHPGWTATELQRHTGLLAGLNNFFGQPIEMGALPTLYAATAPSVKGKDYFGPGGFKEMKGYPKKVSSTPLSQNQTSAEQLWQVSEKLTGVKYAIH